MIGKKRELEVFIFCFQLFQTISVTISSDIVMYRLRPAENQPWQSISSKMSNFAIVFEILFAEFLKS